MNILFYCPFKFDIRKKNLTKLGGIENLNYELCNNLSKTKFKIYLATNCKKIIKVKRLTNIPIHKLTSKTNKFKFDIIVSSNDTKIFDYYKYSKKILWLHNTLSIEKALRKKKLYSIFKHKINAVFVSKYLQNITTNLFFFNKQKVIRNFLSNKFKTNKINFKREPIIVWSVQRDKGLNETIDMWINKINNKNKKIKFYIFGIKKNFFKKKIDYYKKYNIFFYGRVPKERLFKIYNKSIAMICLGYDETFCLNALEANACGLPILTFGKTALKDFSVNNYNSFILNNFDELSKKIISISNNNINKKLIANSVKESKKYHLKNIIYSWLELFKKV